MSTYEERQQVRQEEAAARRLEREMEMELQRQMKELERLEEAERKLEETIAIARKIAENVMIREQGF